MDKDTALELYKVFRSERNGNFVLHQDALEHYLTFTVAILGATIAGALGIRGMGWTGTVVLLGPILNVVVCLLAVRMCDRYYLGALEKIAILAKLESVLGLRDRLDLTSGSREDAGMFTEDRYFLPERWIKGTRHATTTEEFVRQHLNVGVNRIAKQTFHFLILVNVLLGAVIVIVALL